MDTGFLFTTIIAFMSLYHLMILAVPVREQHNNNWRNPCGGSAQSSSPWFSDTEITVTDTLELIVQQFDEAQKSFQMLRNSYRFDRVASRTSGDKCSFSDDYDNIFLHVPGFPDMNSIQDGNIFTLCVNLGESLLQDYENLVRVMIFLEQTIKDETIHENGRYSPELNRSYNLLLDAMCNFNTLEYRCAESQKNLYTSTIVFNYQTESIFMRHKRDYVFVKDMEILLTLLKNKYKKCRTLYSYYRL